MASQIILSDVILKHDIPVSTRYGTTTHVLVFYNSKDNSTWVWKTSTFPVFDVNKSYSIIATDEGDYNISHVKMLGPEIRPKSEQQKRLNALDILIPDTHLTNDEKYDIISQERSE